MLRSHDLGDNRQSGFGPRGGQHLQPQLLVALKAVGAGPGLERAAPQTGRAQILELAGQDHDLLFALHRTGASNDRHPGAADFEAPGLDNGSFSRELRRSTLVWGHDWQDLLDPLAWLEHLGQPRPFLAKRRNDCLVLAVNHLGVSPNAVMRFAM